MEPIIITLKDINDIIDEIEVQATQLSLDEDYLTIPTNIKEDLNNKLKKLTKKYIEEKTKKEIINQFVFNIVDQIMREAVFILIKEHHTLIKKESKGVIQ